MVARHPVQMTLTEKEATKKIIHAEHFPDMVQGFVELHSPSNSDESIENRAPETPKLCPRASRERRLPTGKTNWEVRMEHERKRSGSRGRANHSNERLIQNNSNNISYENPILSTTPESSFDRSRNTPNRDQNMDDDTLLDPEEPTPRACHHPSKVDENEGQVVSEYRTEKNIVRIRRVIEFSPPRTSKNSSKAMPLKLRNVQNVPSSYSAPRPITSSGIREHTKHRISSSSSHQSLPSSPQIERKGRIPKRSLYTSKIPLKRGSSLENKMKSIEKKINQIQNHLKMNNIEKPQLVIPNDVCTETSKRDLMLHETVCDAGAKLRQKVKEQEEEFERSQERLSINSNNSYQPSKTPSPSKNNSHPETSFQEIPVPIYRSINNLFTSSPQKLLDQWQPMDLKTTKPPQNIHRSPLTAENPLLSLSSATKSSHKSPSLVDPYKVSRLTEPPEASDLEKTPIKPGVYTTMTLPRRQMEDENGYAIPGSTRAMYMNLTYDSNRPLAESTPIKNGIGIDKIGYRTPSPVERILERKRVNRSLGFDDLVKAGDPSVLHITPPKYQRIPSIPHDKDSSFRRNVSFSPKVNTTHEDFKSAVEESFDTDERENRLSNIIVQSSPYRSVSVPMNPGRQGYKSGSSFSSTGLSSESIRSLGESAILAEKLNKSLEQVNEALDRTRSHLGEVVDKFDQTLNNVNTSIHISKSLQELQSLRRSPAYKAALRPTLLPPPPPETSKSPISIQLSSTMDQNFLTPHIKGVDTAKLKPTLTSPPPPQKPSTSDAPEVSDKRVEFDLKGIGKENGSSREYGSTSKETTTRPRSDSIDEPIHHKPSAASITLLLRAQECYKRHKQALKDYTKVKILAYNIKADEYKKSGHITKYQEIKSKIDLLIKKCNEEKRLIKEAYKNPNREMLKEYAKKIEAIQKATMELQDKAMKPRIRRRANSASSTCSSSSSLTTASMLKDEEYTQKMNILRHRRENADRILRIAQKLKKEEKDVERLEKKAFTTIAQIGSVSNILGDSSFSERDVPRKLATAVQNVENLLQKEESPPPTAGRALDERNAKLREELEKKRRFSDKLYKEFCQRNKEMLQNEEISLNTQIDAYNKYIEEAQKLEELEKAARQLFSTEEEKFEDEVFTSSSVKLSSQLSTDSTPPRKLSLEGIHTLPKLSISSGQTPKLSARVPRLSLSSDSSIPPRREEKEDSSRTLTDNEKGELEVQKPEKVLTPVDASVPRLDLSALQREFSVEKKEGEQFELPSDVAYKPDGYEKDVAHFVHEKEAEQEQKPTQDANKETSRDISSIHEIEAVPPPAALPVQDYINRKPKYVQTSADREKNTENDVSSIQDIQELPDSTPRSLSMALDSIETPVEQEPQITQEEFQFQLPDQEKSEASVFSAMSPLENVINQEKSEASVFSAMSPLENVISIASSLESLPMDNAISGLDELPESGKTDNHREVDEPSQSPSKARKQTLEVLSARKEERDKESDPERVPSAKSHLNLSNSSISKRDEDVHSPIPTPPYMEPSVIISIGTGQHVSHISGGGSRIISQYSTNSSRTNSSVTVSSLAGISRKSSQNELVRQVENPEEPVVEKVEISQVSGTKASSISSMSGLDKNSLQELKSQSSSTRFEQVQEQIESGNAVKVSKISSISSFSSIRQESFQDFISPPVSATKNQEIQEPIEIAKVSKDSRSASISSISSIGQKSFQDLMSPPVSSPKVNWKKLDIPSSQPQPMVPIVSTDVEKEKEPESVTEESIAEEIVEDDAETVEDSSVTEEIPASEENSESATKTEVTSSKSVKVVVTHTETITTTTISRPIDQPIITSAEETPREEVSTETSESTETEEASESEESSSSTESEDDETPKTKPVLAKEPQETDSSIAEEIPSEEVKSAKSMSSSLGGISSSKEQEDDVQKEKTGMTYQKDETGKPLETVQHPNPIYQVKVPQKIKEDDSPRLISIEEAVPVVKSTFDDQNLSSIATSFGGHSSSIDQGTSQKVPWFEQANKKPLSTIELVQDDVHPDPPKPEEPMQKSNISIILEDDYSPAARMERAKARFIQRASLPSLTRTDSLDSVATNSTPKQSPRSPLLSGRFFEKFPKNISPRTSPRNSFPLHKSGSGGSPRFSLEKDLITFSPRDLNETSHGKRTSSISSEKSIFDDSERSTGRLSSKSSVGFLEDSLHATNLLELSTYSENSGGKTSLNFEDLKTDAILDALLPQKQKTSVSTIPEEDSIASTISSEFQLSTASGTSEASTSATISASEPSLPSSETQIRFLVKNFSKQLWPQFEAKQKDFSLNLEKIENGKSQHDEYEQSFIEALVDFTMDIVKQMASNSRYWGKNQVYNKFYFRPKPNSSLMFTQMIEDEVCARVLRIQNSESKNGFRRLVEPRYVRVARFPTELDPVDHILLDELYQSEPAWTDVINECLEKVEKSKNI
uniref:Uncharacterized protein n=1 Tax=Acrobeloides nanus TaxID=290746 RepID=A0A914C7Y9_9BILA